MNERPRINQTTEPQSPTLRGKIIEAINSALETDDIRPLLASLYEMNQALTGRPQGHFSQRDEQLLQAMVTDFITRARGDKLGLFLQEIYMGDFGVSRLFLKAEGEKVDVILSGVSSNKVKQKWEELNSKQVNSQ